MMRNQKEIYEDRYLTFAFRDEMMKYMEEHKDEPFFIYGAFSAPHVPFQAPVNTIASTRTSKTRTSASTTR